MASLIFSTFIQIERTSASLLEMEALVSATAFLNKPLLNTQPIFPVLSNHNEALPTIGHDYIRGSKHPDTEVLLFYSPDNSTGNDGAIDLAICIGTPYTDESLNLKERSLVTEQILLWVEWISDLNIAKTTDYHDTPCPTPTKTQPESQEKLVEVASISIDQEQPISLKKQKHRFKAATGSTKIDVSKADPIPSPLQPGQEHQIEQEYKQEFILGGVGRQETLELDEKIKETEYHIYENRLRSYDLCQPSSIIYQKRFEFAAAGFYYLGAEDRVQCYSCKGVMRAWKDRDDVFVEHKHAFPSCKLAQKTNKFLRRYGLQYPGHFALFINKKTEKRRCKKAEIEFLTFLCETIDEERAEQELYEGEGINDGLNSAIFGANGLEGCQNETSTPPEESEESIEPEESIVSEVSEEPVAHTHATALDQFKRWLNILCCLCTCFTERQ